MTTWVAKGGRENFVSSRWIRKQEINLSLSWFFSPLIWKFHFIFLIASPFSSNIIFMHTAKALTSIFHTILCTALKLLPSSFFVIPKKPQRFTQVRTLHLPYKSISLHLLFPSPPSLARLNAEEHQQSTKNGLMVAHEKLHFVRGAFDFR